MKQIKRTTNKLKTYDADFLQKLAHLLNSGFTQKDALTFLIEQYEVLNKKDKIYLITMIHEGKNLEDILHYLGFKPSVLAQIRFSTVHGEIITILEHCSAYLIRKRKTIKNLMKSLQYPIILITLFIIILIALNYTVIPQFNTLYESMGTHKSTLMTILTTALNLLPKIVLILFILLFIFSVVVASIIQMKNIDKKCAYILKVPVIGTYYRYIVTYKFSRELGFMFNSGIETKEIIHILKSQDLDLELKFLGENIESHLLSGKTFSETVKNIRVLDERILPFIRHGEHNSNVGKELSLYSEYVLEGVIYKIEKLTRRIQPFIFIILGFLVICLYLVIVLPVFQMMSDLN